MATQENPQLNRMIQNRIYGIYQKKIANPTYDGGIYFDPQLRTYMRHKIQKKVSKRMAKGGQCPCCKIYGGMCGCAKCCGGKPGEKRMQQIFKAKNQELAMERPDLYQRKSSGSMGYGSGMTQRKFGRTQRKFGRTLNPWVSFLTDWIEQNPNVPKKQAFKLASKAYKRMKKSK